MNKSHLPKAEADALAALIDDHRAVKKQFKAFQDADDLSEKSSIALEVCRALTVHSTIEEELFYPSLRGISDDIDAMLDEAEVEHNVAKDLIAAIESEAEGDLLKANFTVLSEYISHHITEEEDELFKAVIKEKVDLREVAESMAQRKQELEEQTA